MKDDLFNAELEATRSLMELYEQAKKCQALFERAHMALPEPLRRVLGMDGSGKAAAPPSIAPPERPPMPIDAGPDWAWISVTEASPATVAAAVLRGAKKPLRPKDIIDRVTAILPEVPAGSIYNVGPRLERQQVIRRGEEGWELVKPDSAGLIHKGHFWGPPSAFGKIELAAQRRMALLHVLSFNPTGLQILQMLEQLKRCSWVIAPINKDLVKEDISVLAGSGQVRRRGNTRNWEIVRKTEE